MIIEVKKNGDRKEVNLYYSKRSKSSYQTFINQDYNSLLQLFFDLQREGFPIKRAAIEFLKKIEKEDWLF